jgi:hypothetical protein
LVTGFHDNISIEEPGKFLPEHQHRKKEAEQRTEKWLHLEHHFCLLTKLLNKSKFKEAGKYNLSILLLIEIQENIMSATGS